MISQTYELRKQHGKFTPIASDNLEAVHHVNTCQACGSSRPEHLEAVQAGSLVLLVGSTCAGILTSAKLPAIDAALKGSGETYQDGERTFIYPTAEWLAAARQKNERHSGAATFIFVNRFVLDMCDLAAKTGKLSIKQFEAASKVLAGMA